MFKTLKIFFHHGKQFIPNVRKAKVSSTFRGMPVLSDVSEAEAKKLAEVCPVGAISSKPFSLDLGKCLFCGECAFHSEAVKFTNNYRIASSSRDGLVVTPNSGKRIFVKPEEVRKEIHQVFGRSLKLRQISAGGDGSAELELGASSNANFNMDRYGIEFTASPRHADGIVITGPISKSMAEAVKMSYEAISDPKIVILCGTDAISGGVFKDGEVDRSFLDEVKVDLFIPGNPPHPLTFVNGVLDFMGKRS